MKVLYHNGVEINRSGMSRDGPPASKLPTQTSVKIGDAETLKCRQTYPCKREALRKKMRHHEHRASEAQGQANGLAHLAHPDADRRASERDAERRQFNVGIAAVTMFWILRRTRLTSAALLNVINNNNHGESTFFYEMCW